MVVWKAVSHIPYFFSNSSSTCFLKSVIRAFHFSAKKREGHVRVQMKLRISCKIYVSGNWNTQRAFTAHLHTGACGVQYRLYRKIHGYNQKEKG